MLHRIADYVFNFVAFHFVALVKFLVGENDGHLLRQKLVQNCNHINDEVMM